MQEPILRCRKPMQEPMLRSRVCFLATSSMRRPCVVCNDGSHVVKHPKTYCPSCNNKFMCWRSGCFQKYHENLQ